MKNFVLSTVLVVFGLSTWAIATETVVETTEAEAPAAQEPAPQEKETVSIDAIKTQCAACHGADGNSAAPTYPKIAGQNAKYLVKQMEDIKSGARSVPVMTGQLDNVSSAQIKALADYYSSQEIKSLSPVNKELLPLGERIYRLGDISKGLPACTGCHSPTGKGNGGAGFPALGGQHADYIATSLKAFREGAEYADKGRRNDEMQSVMRTIALRMSDKEIEAVSNYISSLY